jgi:hypothetical protein
LGNHEIIGTQVQIDYRPLIGLNNRLHRFA